MTRYVVQGTFHAGRRAQSFKRELDAASARHAEDKVFSQLTSQHGISRANVTVDEVQEA